MKLGHTVFVKDEDLQGQITRIELDRVWIITSDGFELEFALNDLVVAGENLSKTDLFRGNTAEVIKEKEYRDKPLKQEKTRQKGIVPPMEVDLHIDKLLDRPKGLSNFEIINIQMETAKRQLEFAIRKRIQRVIFIHGVGEGVLKAELLSLIRRYDGLNYSEADSRKYGAGATEVYIPQKNIFIGNQE